MLHLIAESLFRVIKIDIIHFFDVYVEVVCVCVFSSIAVLATDIE